ncbi:hypothetical protein [Dactylosporangium sp. NPDC005555]|uniref:hypothetical protein n=1 Tax=Dactylosporangium sp. NPDC005555 TaxID=3154889 RepID=UPI0033A8FB0C
MPTPPLHADTDLLRGEAFADFVAHVQAILDKVNAAAGDHLPVAAVIRDDSDEVLNTGLADKLGLALQILYGLRDLSGGHAGQVEELSALLRDVEDINEQMAADFGGGGNARP